MNRYSKYKPSGIDWIGEIPCHWELENLGYSSRMIVPMRDKPKELSGNIPWLRIEDFNGKYISESKSNQGVTEETISEMNLKVFPVGTVLCSCSCAMGKTAIVQKPLITNQTFIGIVPSKKINSDYLFYLMNTSEQYLNSISTGAIQTYLSREDFEKLKVTLPPLEEQTIIANFLDEKTTQIDKLISNKQKLIELLKEERTAIINEAVSAEGKNWERKKLKYVAKKVQTGSTPPSNKEQYYSEEVNWFTPSDFSENLLLQNSKRKIAELAITDGVVKIFPANSVLFVGIGATLGKVGYIIEPATSNQQINCLSFQSKEEAIFYANYFYSNQPNIVALANTATLAILNQSQMKDIMLPIPSSLDVLKATIQYIETETQRIDSTVSKIEKEIELMQEYRTTLISEVVTGKIKVV